MPITKSANSLKMGFLCLPSSYQLVLLLRQLKDMHETPAMPANASQGSMSGLLWIRVKRGL